MSTELVRCPDCGSQIMDTTKKYLACEECGWDEVPEG